MVWYGMGREGLHGKSLYGGPPVSGSKTPLTGFPVDGGSGSATLGLVPAPNDSGSRKLGHDLPASCIRHGAYGMVLTP